MRRLIFDEDEEDEEEDGDNEEGEEGASDGADASAAAATASSSSSSSSSSSTPPGRPRLYSRAAVQLLGIILDATVEVLDSDAGLDWALERGIDALGRLFVTAQRSGRRSKFVTSATCFFLPSLRGIGRFAALSYLPTYLSSYLPSYLPTCHSVCFVHKRHR